MIDNLPWGYREPINPDDLTEEEMEDYKDVQNELSEKQSERIKQEDYERENEGKI